MNSQMPRFLVGAIIALAIAWAVIAVRMPQSAEAGGVVTNCTAQGLDAALAGGGTITFNCNNNYSPATIFFGIGGRTIGANTTIDGANGGNPISIVPVDDTRAFSVTQGIALTLKNLSITDGFDSGGGCIYTNGALTLDNVRLQNCLASTGNSGGAIFVSSTGSATINNSQVLSNTARISGGAVYSLGSLSISGSLFEHNRLPDGQSNPSGDGGGIWAIGNTTIDSTTFYSNTAANGYGGAIYSQGTLRVTNSTISSNRVQKGGGGIQTYLGTTTLENVNVISNTVAVYDSHYGGGGLMNSQGTLNLTNVTISGNNANFAGGGIRNDGAATLSNVTVSNNLAEYGGGIRVARNASLTYNGGTVSGNSAYENGGIYIMTDALATLTNLTISGNRSQSYGGGVYNAGAAVLTNVSITGNTSQSSGGGIWGNVTLVDSTVSGNTAYNGGGIGGGGFIYKSTVSGNTATNDGGGIWAGTSNIVDSTISGNRAYEHGGGIYLSGGTTSFFNVTDTKNRANSDNSGTGHGGGIANAGGSFYFVNSIIADNYNVLSGPTPTLNPEDCYGTLNSQGYNIMSNTDICTVTGPAPTITSPNLGSLQNNGGSTQTHALLAGSPAIDTGDPAGCKDNNSVILSVDQRGYARTVNGRCDIGAYEYNPNPPTSTPTSTPAPTSTPTATPCASAPLNFTLLKPANDASVGKVRVDLDWEDAPCAAKYKVIVKAGSKSGSKVDHGKVAVSQYKTKALPAGVYYWRVKACDSVGCTSSVWFHFKRK